MTRPHPLAIILFVTLLLLAGWLLNLVAFPSRIVVDKLPYNGYWLDIGNNDREFVMLPFAPSVFAGILIALLPAVTLHRLLRRKLQIHLFTAVLLTLAVATLLALNFHPHKVPTRLPFGDAPTYIELQYGWPQSVFMDPSDVNDLAYSLDSSFWNTPVWYTPAVVGNVLIALAILSTVLLLSELLLTRRTAPREATP